MQEYLQFPFSSFLFVLLVPVFPFQPTGMDNAWSSMIVFPLRDSSLLATSSANAINPPLAIFLLYFVWQRFFWLILIFVIIHFCFGPFNFQGGTYDRTWGFRKFNRFSRSYISSYRSSFLPHVLATLLIAIATSVSTWKTRHCLIRW